MEDPGQARLFDGGNGLLGILDTWQLGKPLDQRRQLFVQQGLSARQAQHAEWEKLEPPQLLGTPEALLPERPPLQDAVTPTKHHEGLDTAT